MAHSCVRKYPIGIMRRKTFIIIVMCSIIFLSNCIMLGSCAGKKAQIKELNKRGTSSSKNSVGSKKKESEKGKRVKTRRVILPTKKESLSSRAFKGMSVLKSSLLSSADAALSSTSKVQRQLKSYFSSDFEVLLLRMTAPDNLRLADDDLERFIATIETFVRNMDVTCQSNPYRVTLRKIWTKAAETDGRSVLKAQFLLHTLLRGTTPEDSLIFKTLLKKMLREKCKKTNSKYFDIAKISLVSADTSHLKDFITRYSVYIFQRAKTFTSCFEEMKLIGDGMRTEDICAQLMKAVKVLNSALNCGTAGKDEGKDEEKDEECNVVLSCIELVAQDVRDLFTLFHAKLLWILNEEKAGDIFEGWEVAEVRAILSHLKTFYCDRFEDIEELLIETAEILERRCNVILPINLPIPASFDDVIPGTSSYSGDRSFPSISHLESSSGETSSSYVTSYEHSDINELTDQEQS